MAAIKKKRVLILASILVTVGFLLREEPKKITFQKPVPQKVSLQRQKPETKIPLSSTAPQVRKPASIKKPSPQELRAMVVADPSVKINKNSILTQNIGAVVKNQYNKKMGEFIYEDDKFAYFKKTYHAAHIVPVGFSKFTNSFHPIASAVHVRGVDEGLKNQLAQEGYSIGYYNPRLKFLSVSTSPDKVVKLYKDLANQGLNAKLELLKNYPEVN